MQILQILEVGKLILQTQKLYSLSKNAFEVNNTGIQHKFWTQFLHLQREILGELKKKAKEDCNELQRF